MSFVRLIERVNMRLDTTSPPGLGARVVLGHSCDRMRARSVEHWISRLTLSCSAFAASGCLSELWPNDVDHDGERCVSTRVAPKLSADAGSITLDVEPTEVARDMIAVNARGTGRDFIGAIRLEGGVGTIDVGCKELPAAVYTQRQDGEASWFKAMVVDSDRWYTVTLACEGDALDHVWYHGTDGTTWANEDADGSCREVSARQRTRVRLPSSKLIVPGLVQGYRIDGRHIQLSEDGAGTVTLGGVEQSLYVVDDDECAANCAVQLSILSWEADSGRATYGELYLWLDGDMTLRDSLTLPDFHTRLEDQAFFWSLRIAVKFGDVDGRGS